MSELHVRVDGSGRDVVLLHGWGFHSGAWSGIAEALAARYRVRRVDLPGHGLSAAPPPAHFDAAADEVARCIPASGMRKTPSFVMTWVAMSDSGVLRCVD